MNSIIRKSLLAGAMAALVAVPMGAAAESYMKSGAKHQMRSQMGTSGHVHAMTPSQLRGAEVVGANGEAIGSVKTVVQSRQDKHIHAVISAGGLLGVGDKEITVPLDRLHYLEGKLRLSATEDELKARPTYRAEQYVELQPMDQPISEFSAFETTTETSASRRGSMEIMWADPNGVFPEGPRITP